MRIIDYYSLTLRVALTKASRIEYDGSVKDQRLLRGLIINY